MKKSQAKKPPKKKSKPDEQEEGQPLRRSGRRAASFLLTEATESGTSSHLSEQEDEVSEEEGGTQSSFIDDQQSQPEDSEVAHMATDNRLRDQEATITHNVQPVILQPYFPSGLARSLDRPTEFDFTMFLYDKLRLPRGLFADDEEVEVQFENVTQCRDYCRRYVNERSEWCSRQPPTVDTSQQRRNELSKEALFRQAGRPLQIQMSTGNDAFDCNLQDLRLDLFGNVMFLKAPFWSDISAQFTHGFPRRLVVDGHAGILPGNMTVAARISNQAVRSLATGDIAAFISERMVQGLGLTTSELILARASAIKYAGQQNKPARLIDFMLRFGLDFLTINPLPMQQLEELRNTTSTYWTERVGQSADESSGSSDESELSVTWDTREEVESMPPHGSNERALAVVSHVSNLVLCYVSGDRPQGTTETQQTVARSGTSGMTRRRKQAAPRRALTSVPSVSQVSSAESGTSRHPMGAEEEEDVDRQERTPPAVPDPREALLAMQGVQGSRIPNNTSLNRLRQFLKDNQPCDPQRAAEATASDTQTSEEARQAAALDYYRQVRDKTVCEGVTSVWAAMKADCMCLADAIGSSSQGSTDANCPYCIRDEEGGDVSSVTSRCHNQECNVCLMMNKLDKSMLAAVGLKRNERLTVMLELAPGIARCLNSGEVPPDRRQVLVEAFCKLLSCSRTKLRFVGNVGFLVMVCPRLKHLQLEKGWGEVWCNLSKVASAIGYHDSLNSQLAALMFMREKCIPDRENKWKWYLDSQQEVEQQINREIFGGQFQLAGETSTAGPSTA